MQSFSLNWDTLKYTKEITEETEEKTESTSMTLSHVIRKDRLLPRQVLHKLRLKSFSFRQSLSNSSNGFLFVSTCSRKPASFLPLMSPRRWPGIEPGRTNRVTWATPPRAAVSRAPSKRQDRFYAPKSFYYNWQLSSKKYRIFKFISFKIKLSNTTGYFR